MTTTHLTRDDVKQLSMQAYWRGQLDALEEADRMLAAYGAGKDELGRLDVVRQHAQEQLDRAGQS